MKKIIKKKYKVNMTRLFSLVFGVLFVVSLFMGINALAETSAFKLMDVTIKEKTATTTGEITNISSDEVKDTVTFHQLNDYVTYKMTIKNNKDKEITIVSISDDNNNEYIEYLYDKHENEKINAGNTFDFLVKATYKKELEDISKRDQNTTVKFIINYLEDGEEKDDTIIINPVTNDNIIMNFVMLFVSTTGLVVCIVLDKKKRNKRLSKASMFIITGLLLTPIIVKAAAFEYDLSLVSRYGLYDKEIVKYVVNGEEKQIINKYGEPITGLETPTKKGYTFTKWTYENGKDFDPTKSITEDTKIIANFSKDRYTISYDLAGGVVSKANPVEYTVTDEITLIEPTKENYDFIGWTGTGITTPTKNLIIKNEVGNKEYKANYEPTTYTITYKGLTNEEKTSLNNPTSYNIETSKTKLNNPQDRKDEDDNITERFVGWKDNDTTSIEVEIPNVNSMGNKTFEAIWVEEEYDTYTITYNLNGGVVSEENKTSFTKKTKTFTLNNPTKTGYTFKGWSGTDLIGDENKVVKVEKGTAKNLSFEAHYIANTYTIKYDKNGGTGSMSDQEMTYDTARNLSKNTYTKEGYTFKGWNTSADGKGTSYNDEAVVENLAVSGNITLYAKWEANNYEIVFNSNHANTEGTMSNLSMTYDTSKALTINAYTLSGYTFDGWNTKPDGTGTNYTNGEAVNNLTTSGTITLYAKWKANTYTVVFEKNTGTGTMENQTITYDEATKLTKNAYTKEGYTFVSWNTEPDGTGTSYSDEESVKNLATSGNVTLFAQYEINSYVVTFDTKGGTSVSTRVKNYNEAVGDLPETTKENYSFIGWFTEEEDGEQITKDTLITDTVTFFAHWTNKYVVTFNVNGGDGNNSTKELLEDEALGELPDASSGRKIFLGWYTDQTDGEKVDENYIPNRTMTLYARYKDLLCQKATTLHTDTCGTGGSCNNAGYKDGGSKGTTTITYGSISYSTLIAGDAFDCDVNGDGRYDADNERFYYLRTVDNKAVLISHTNYQGEEGQATNDNYVYGVALTKLPTTSDTEWKNVEITFNNEFDTSDTTTYAARFVSYDDLREATGKETLTASGSLDDYAYLYENTRFVSNTTGRSGMWMQPETVSGTTKYYRYHSGTGNRNVTEVSITGSSPSKNVARPVIEVPMEYMDTSSKDAVTYTITFDTNGGRSLPDVEIEEYTAIGALPEPTRSGYEFVGWYYEPEFTNEVKETDIFTEDTTIYAKWNATAVAEINGTYYNTLAAAISAVPTTGVKTTVKLIKNTTESITIPNTKNVELDLNGFTVNNTSTSVINNNGTLEIKNGTISCSAGSGAIDNNSGATFYMSSGKIEATGTRQGLYNDGGTATISGTAVIESASNQRAAIQNRNNGTVTITGGTIISKSLYALYNESGTITIGTKDNAFDNTTPVIQGKTFAIAANNKYNFYDGILKGGTSAAGTTSNTGNTPTVTADTNETKINDLEDNSTKVYGTESIDGTTYKTLYCTIDNSSISVTFNPMGGKVTPTSKVIDSGDKIGELPTPTKGVYNFDGWFTEKTGGEEIDENTIPIGNVTYYAHWTYVSSNEVVSFNMNNDALDTYFTNISTWKDLDQATFKSNMSSNFTANSCSACNGSNACNSPAAGTYCEQPKGYDTALEDDLLVYTSDENTKEKGSLVTYTTSTDGTIYNMIPGETYYWESSTDSNIHGLVKATANRRTIKSSVRNVRDLGGLEVNYIDEGITKSGTIKYGKLFRGAQLSSSSTDVTELAKLGVDYEIDLRPASDGKSQAAFTNHDNDIIITNYLIYPDTYASNYTALKNALKDTMNYVIAHKDDDKALYFHCTIGTDRTGTLAYFLEGLLGVSEEDRVEDYELSYYYGMTNRDRYHDNLSGSNINPRFTTMHNTYDTNEKIYNWFMQGSTDQEADQQLINNFRQAMINYN